MRKASRHSAILLLIGVFALGLLGAAYTLWYEDLKLNVDVTTSTLDADVSVHPWIPNEQGPGGAFQTAAVLSGSQVGSGRPVVIQCSQPIPTNFTTSANYVYNNLAQFGCTFGDFPVGKPTTICNSSISTDALAGGNEAPDNNVLTLSLSGLYPYAGCTYRLDIHNSGNVPLHLSIKPTGGAWICSQPGITNPTDPSCSPVPPAPNNQALSFPGLFLNCFGALSPNLQLVSAPNVPIQLHTGEEALCDLNVLLDQGANLENSSIIVRIEYTAYQWNERP